MRYRNACVIFGHSLTIIDQLEHYACVAIIWNKLPLPTGCSLIRKSFRDCFTIAHRLRTIRTIRLLTAAIYICIGKQICPEDNGWSDRRVTERVPETCTKFLHGSVINELALRANKLSLSAIFNPQHENTIIGCKLL